MKLKNFELWGTKIVIEGTGGGGGGGRVSFEMKNMYIFQGLF